MRHHLILRVITKILIPPILLFGLYVQFHGDFGPGGGFQAGVIISSAFVLYALVFGLAEVQRILPPSVTHALAAIGVFIYSGTGIAGLLLGGNYLDYFVLGHGNHGQHTGILLVEFGVLVTVASVMIAIFYAFAGRSTPMRDEDW